MEALERETRLCAVDGWFGRRAWRRIIRDDRRDLFEGTPHRDQHGHKKGGRGRLFGRTKDGMNTKLYAVCGSLARPIDLFVTTGQVSDYIGAQALLGRLPNVKLLLGDRGYDADWFREALPDKDTRRYPWTQATQDAGQI